MPSIGPMEIVIVLILMLVVFGPKRLPELGRSLGGGMREFKQSITAAGAAVRHDAPPSEVAQPRELDPAGVGHEQR